jgi:hypothetical protein
MTFIGATELATDRPAKAILLKSIEFDLQKQRSIVSRTL